MTHSLTYAETLLSQGKFWAGLETGLTGASADRVTLARQTYRDMRRAHGYVGGADMLTKPEAQAKLGKSERYALGLMLTPERNMPRELLAWAGLRETINLCPLASLGCAGACLYTSGHGAFTATQRARQIRTLFLLAHPYDAGVIIGAEIRRTLRGKRWQRDAVTLRLNVTSDIRFELLAGAHSVATALREEYGVRLYDYTAWKPALRGDMESLGWHLTYSAKETAHTSDAYLASILETGANVAMPFHVDKRDALPATYTLDGMEFAVIDGDLTDDRTDDPRGVIVGLRAKGRAGKADTSGFIRTV